MEIVAQKLSPMTVSQLNMVALQQNIDSTGPKTKKNKSFRS